MSFLTRTLNTGRAIATAVPSIRISAVRTSRTLTTSSPLFKTPTETVKDGLKTVDRAVSDKLVDGLNIATSTKDKVKETAENISQSDAAGKAKEIKGAAAGKAEELKGEAKGSAEQAKGKAKAAAEEVRSNL